VEFLTKETVLGAREEGPRRGGGRDSETARDKVFEAAQERNYARRDSSCAGDARQGSRKGQRDDGEASAQRSSRVSEGEEGCKVWVRNGSDVRQLQKVFFIDSAMWSLSCGLVLLARVSETGLGYAQGRDGTRIETFCLICCLQHVCGEEEKKRIKSESAPPTPRDDGEVKGKKEKKKKKERVVVQGFDGFDGVGSLW
jgi:hypothetical protein